VRRGRAGQEGAGGGGGGTGGARPRREGGAPAGVAPEARRPRGFGRERANRLADLRRAWKIRKLEELEEREQWEGLVNNF